MVGAALSTVSTFVQRALVLFVGSPPTLTALTPALAAGGLTAAIYGLAFTLSSLGSDNPGQTHQARAFNLQASLVLAATMAVMLVLAAALKDRLGEAGVVVGAALAGLVDTHAAAISIASLTAAEKLRHVARNCKNVPLRTLCCSLFENHFPEIIKYAAIMITAQNVLGC